MTRREKIILAVTGVVAVVAVGYLYLDAGPAAPTRSSAPPQAQTQATAQVRETAQALARQAAPGGVETALLAALDKPWREARAEAGLEDFRFHDLRHSAASYLAMSGASLMDIAAILGHKTLAMVKRYSHLSEQHTTAAVDRMAEKFLG